MPQTVTLVIRAQRVLGSNTDKDTCILAQDYVKYQESL